MIYTPKAPVFERWMDRIALLFVFISSFFSTPPSLEDGIDYATDNRQVSQRCVNSVNNDSGHPRDMPLSTVTRSTRRFSAGEAPPRRGALRMIGHFPDSSLFAKVAGCSHLWAAWGKPYTRRPAHTCLGCRPCRSVQTCRSHRRMNDSFWSNSAA